MSQYTIDYTAPEEREDILVPSNPRSLPPRRRFEIPSMVKTGIAFVAAGAIFFGAETYAPADWKPSHFTGTYDARLASQVKAAELKQQSVYDAYVENVRLTNAQNLEKYKSASGSVLAYYNASYDRAKVFADATARIQTQYVAARMDQTRTRQSTDNTVINYARMWGRLSEALSPGSGTSALAYADNLSAQLDAELTAAALHGQTISVEGWDTNLPSPLEVQAQLEALKPVPLPEPPQFDRSIPSDEH